MSKLTSSFSEAGSSRQSSSTRKWAVVARHCGSGMVNEISTFANEHALAFFDHFEAYGMEPSMDFCGGRPVPLLTLAEAERFLLPLIQLPGLPVNRNDGDYEARCIVERKRLIRAFKAWGDDQYEQGGVSYWTSFPRGVRRFILTLRDVGYDEDDVLLCCFLHKADYKVLRKRVHRREVTNCDWECARTNFWTRDDLEALVDDVIYEFELRAKRGSMFDRSLRVNDDEMNESDEFDEEDEVAVSMAIPGGRAGGQLQSRSHSGDTKLGDLL